MSKRTFLGWAPVAVFAAYFGISSLLKARSPSSFCSPINAGGKELVCGFEYSVPAVQTMSVLFWVVYFGMLVLAGHQAFRQRLSKFGVLGFLVSTLVVLAILVLRNHLGSEDSP